MRGMVLVNSAMWLVLAVVGALSTSISTAQQPQPAKSWRFEVAAIKPSNPKLEANSGIALFLINRHVNKCPLCRRFRRPSRKQRRLAESGPPQRPLLFRPARVRIGDKMAAGRQWQSSEQVPYPVPEIGMAEEIHQPQLRPDRVIADRGETDRGAALPASQEERALKR